MRYTVLLSIEVDAQSDDQAHEQAIKLREMLKSPLVRMAVEGDGVRLFGDGRPVVYEPQRGGL